ncbi:MAG: plastocyanin/azurin family copper-binding protein [Thermoplasmata archaeon]|nr:plastocyanin/azurin family copper-binding protein [Thermoplasmata archaeon]
MSVTPALATFPHPGTSHPAAGGVDQINVNTLSNLGYDPSTITVHPGDQVQLVVTQMANFEHTFVLSPLANFTFDNAATAANLTLFFRAHAPIVNLTVAGTVGAKAFANFTAPAVGSYEFVCIEATHFQAGMHGELISTTSTTSAPGTSTTVYLEYGAVAGVVVIVVVLIAVLRMRRMAPPSPPAASP